MSAMMMLMTMMIKSPSLIFRLTCRIARIVLKYPSVFTCSCQLLLGLNPTISTKYMYPFSPTY